MRYTATITFTSSRGKQGRRQFMVDSKIDGNPWNYAYRAGITLAGNVGGHGVHVVGLKAWSEC